MKKIILFMLLMLVTTACFAADGAEAPAWLTAILTFLQGMPYVGPVLVEVLKWTGVVAAVLTALSTAAMLILAALKQAVVWTGWEKGEAAVLWLQKNVLPWLMWVSMYNVQKKQ